MKIKLTHTVTYDLRDPELRKEFAEWCDDYPQNTEMLTAFIKDRFINPNFDLTGGITTIEMINNSESEL